MNRLFYGDNLDVLRRHIATESVDMVYLDPPFNSQQSYNVLFKQRDGTQAASQLHAFKDAWEWDQTASRTYQDVVTHGGKVSEALQAFRQFLGTSDMLAYLTMMAPRLVELHRVLRGTGSLYLHCDPTASHYLKLILDAVFGPGQFRSEVIWKRTSAHSSARRFGPVHDVVLFYGKSDDAIWREQFQPFSQTYLSEFYTHRDLDGRMWRRSDLTANGVRKGDSGKPWRGIDVTAKGRHWAVPGDACDQLGISGGTVQERLDALDAHGRIHWPKKVGGAPQFKRYADEMRGVALQDVWDDIPPLHNLAAERLGYPTQKPEALLERIIRASSDEGGVVLDPFCGCGTTIAAAHRLGRRWIGIDVTQASIVVIKQRFRDHFGIDAPCAVVGEPVSVPDAEALAISDPYQFQWWALGLVGARPDEGKRGADRGIDGRRYFTDPVTGITSSVIFSVKAGHVAVSQLRDLRGVIDREGAAMGALICMSEPTKPMRAEAASAGYVETAWGRYPRLQIRSIAELLKGHSLDAPTALDVTYSKAPKVVPRVAETQPAFNLEPGAPATTRKPVKAKLPLGFSQGKAASRRRA